jgi:hypothetical protein
MRWGRNPRPPAWVTILFELAAIFFLVVAVAGRRTTKDD